MTMVVKKKFSRKEFPILHLLLLLSLVFTSAWSHVTVTKRFKKVAFQTFFKDCLVGAHALVYNNQSLTRAECAGKCIQDGNCMMYCTDKANKLCITSSVFSTDWFTGIPPNTGRTGTVTYDECFSSWAAPESIVRDTMTTTSSGPYNDQRVKELAIDGYFCHAVYYEARRFDGNKRSNNFLQLDLGAVVKVKEIRIALNKNSNAFNSVTIRFGPSATSTSNQIIAQLESGEPSGDLRILLNPSVEGRYLHFLQSVNNFFSIGEIQVLPDE